MKRLVVWLFLFCIIRITPDKTCLNSITIYNDDKQPIIGYSAEKKIWWDGKTIIFENYENTEVITITGIPVIWIEENWSGKLKLPFTNEK